MKIGEKNTLRILRFTSVGAYLGDDHDNDVLLPSKYLTDDMNLDDDIEVYLYRDSEDRLIATTGHPTIMLDGFAFLRVKEVNFYGAFVDWGMEKDLMIPFKEQHIQLMENQYYLTSLQLDESTDRLYGTTKVKKLFYLCDDPSYENKEVSLLIGDTTDLGVKVIVDDKFQGLIYHNDVTRPIKRGDYTTGFVHVVREDGKLDIRLERSGYDKIDDLSQRLLDLLKSEKKLRITDKSDPELIRQVVGMSKKAFKQSVGKLYKERLIVIHDDFIELV
jgi:predicted RNA-binding protein (virulence factor B family)